MKLPSILFLNSQPVAIFLNHLFSIVSYISISEASSISGRPNRGVIAKAVSPRSCPRFGPKWLQEFSPFPVTLESLESFRGQADISSDVPSPSFRVFSLKLRRHVPGQYFDRIFSGRILSPRSVSTSGWPTPTVPEEVFPFLKHCFSLKSTESSDCRMFQVFSEERSWRSFLCRIF